MAEDEYQPTEEDWEEYGRYLDETPETDEDVEKRLAYLFGEEMALSDTIKENLARIPADLQRTAQSAFTDIGNTYQAFLVKDTSFAVLHSSQEIAMQEAVKEIEQPEAPQPSQDIEPER